MEVDIARVKRLMALATGDEKHDASAHSTLDVIWVLFDRILRYGTPQEHDVALGLTPEGIRRRIDTFLGD
jgi:hypothetical protein